MIKTVRLQNFMSAKDATIPMAPITIFTGVTDSGKSIVMRALDAVISNKYPASRYATHGTQKYAVSVVTEKGATTIAKSKVTQYLLIDITSGEKVKKEFNAVGKDIPEDAKMLLDMPYFPLSEDQVLDVLYQSQHKPFFLISEDRTTFSRVIALISNADKLRKLEGSVNSDILITKRNITNLKEIIQDYDVTIETEEVYYNDVKKYHTINEDAISLSNEVSEIDYKLNLLRELLLTKEEIASLSMNEISPLDVSDIDKLSSGAKSLGALKASFEQATLKLPDPLDFNEAWLKERQLIEQKEAFCLPQLQSLELPQINNDVWSYAPKYENLCVELHLSTPEELIFPALQRTIREQAEATLTDISSLAKELVQLEKEQEEANSALKEFNGETCPVCGHILDF